MYEQIRKLVSQIKIHRPLVVNITNQVTMTFVANGLLSLGASPIMTQSTDEIEDLLHIADVVVVNIGTLDRQFIHLCEQVCAIANQLGKPLILDPVGAGASSYRTQTCLDLMKQFHFTLIRGNASEIMALAGVSQNTKGVDSHSTTDYAIESAQLLALQNELIVVISGQTDAIVDASNTRLFKGGSSLMPMVTGSGCLLTAVIGAFCAIHPNQYDAASAAIEFYAHCGELAGQQASGPGSFMPHFLDALSRMPENNND